MSTFKKSFLIVLIALTLTFLLPISNIFGCTVNIVPSKTEVQVGETISVDILRTQTHKTCVLPLDETKIEITNGEIVKDNPWIVGSVDKKTIEVKFTEVGEGIIRVTRDCPKGGLMVWTATVKVVEPLNPNDNSSTSTSTTTPADTSNTSSNTPTSNTSSSTPLTTNTSTSSASSSTKPSTSTSSQTSSTTSTQSSSSSSSSASSSETNTSNSEQSSSNNETTANEAQINPDSQEVSIDIPSETSNNLTNESNASPSNSLKDVFTIQNILYLVLLLLGLVLYILKKFQFRYLLLLFSLAILGFYFGGCSCPVGSIEKMFLNPIGSKVFIASTFILAAVTVITLFKGRVFCGWVCPHGALQEFLYQKKIAIKISSSLDRKLKYLKYVVLVLVVALALTLGTGILCTFEPFKSIYNLSATGFVLIIVILTLAFSVFIYRPWCRYICPFGAYLGIVSFIGNKLHLVNSNVTNSCVLCKSCLRTCPANAIYDRDDHYEIDCKECFTCGDCFSCCPKNKLEK